MKSVSNCGQSDASCTLCKSFANCNKMFRLPDEQVEAKCKGLDSLIINPTLPKTWRVLRIEPRALGWEVQTHPLCYAPLIKYFNDALMPYLAKLRPPGGVLLHLLGRRLQRRHRGRRNLLLRSQGLAGNLHQLFNVQTGWKWAVL